MSRQEYEKDRSLIWLITKLMSEYFNEKESYWETIKTIEQE